MVRARTFAVLGFCILLLVGVWGLKESPQTLPKVQEVLKKPLKELTYIERRDIASAQIKEKKKEIEGTEVRVDTSSIQGRNLGNLYVKYLGRAKGRMPSTVEVSFEERMRSMYHDKIMFRKCVKRDKKSGECLEERVASDTVLSQAPNLLETYLASEKMKMSFPKFIGIAEEKVGKAKKAINWERLCASKAYELSSEKCRLLQAIVSLLNGKDIVAYGMTELLPAADGDLNVKYMDILLRNAGAQFLYHVPALGDGLTSLGLYQFTFLALRKDDIKTEGINVVSAYVDESKGGEKVPGSVVMLSGHQHHTAAFYFAVHNLAKVIRSLGEKETRTLQSIHRSSQDEMVTIIACAHHAPGKMPRIVASWLRDVELARSPSKNKKGTKMKVQAVKTELESHLTGRLRGYGKKTHSNLLAVYGVK